MAPGASPETVNAKPVSAKPPKSNTKPPPKKTPFDGIKQEDLRQISSLSPECTDLKKRYDECFNEWFATKFLVEKTSDMSPCSELLKQYTSCVKAGCKKLGISTADVDCPPIHVGSGQKHSTSATATKSTQTSMPKPKPSTPKLTAEPETPDAIPIPVPVIISTSSTKDK